MFNSLRTRLWLSYTLLIGLVLLVVGIGVTLAVIRSDLPLRQAISNLQLFQVGILPRLQNVADIGPKLLQAVITNQGSKVNGRVLVFNAQGQLVADSLAGQGIPLPDIMGSLEEASAADSLLSYKDNNNKIWYYSVHAVNEAHYIVLAVQRPRLPLLTILRDEFVGPMVQAGLIAMLVSFILSILMTRWVTSPLNTITKEARQVIAGEAHPIPLKGPKEVRNLAHSFNEMAMRVQKSRSSQQDFIANVSHELKTPLTAIQGFTQAILDGTVASAEDIHNAVSVIADESERMHRLVMELLALARLDGEMDEFNKERIAVNPLVTASVKKFGPLAEKSGVTIQLASKTQNDHIIGDADRIMQVLNNLLDNAVKFTPAGGTIQLHTGCSDGMLIIKVKDSGLGIPQEEQEKIFERFYQVEKSRPGGSNRGVGLGLAISKKIVESHNGEISLTSSPGKGSEFVVKLPLSE